MDCIPCCRVASFPPLIHNNLALPIRQDQIRSVDLNLFLLTKVGLFLLHPESLQVDTIFLEKPFHKTLLACAASFLLVEIMVPMQRSLGAQDQMYKGASLQLLSGVI